MNPGELTVFHWPQAPALPSPGQPVLVRVSSAASRGVVRVQLRETAQQILAAWTGRPLHSPLLHETSRGPVCRESVAGYTVNLSFSYSSDAGWIALLLGGPIGVDAMRPEAFPEMPSVTRLYLGPDAWAMIAASTDPARAFAHAWTECEAQLKFFGQGLVEWRERDCPTDDVPSGEASAARVWPRLVARDRLPPPVFRGWRAHPMLRRYVQEHEHTVVTVVTVARLFRTVSTVAAIIR